MFELIRENVGRIVATEYERDKLLREGFALVEPEPEQEPTQEKPIGEMTVDELKEFARLNEIDLEGATLKPEIFEKIKAALEQRNGS